jgi:hypothetical protein
MPDATSLALFAMTANDGHRHCERNRSNPEALSLMPHSSGNPRFDWKTWMAGASPAMTKRDTVFQKQRT